MRETGQQRSGEQAAAGGGADEGEAGQVQANAPRVGALVDDDIQLEIFHRRIEVFLDRLLQPMDFVDEQNVALLQVGEKPGQVAGFLDGRSAGALEVRAHGLGDDVGQRGLAQPGRPAEQNVIDGFRALLRGATVISRRSFTLAWPVNSENRDGRSVISNASIGLGQHVRYRSLSHRLRMGKGQVGAR